MHVRKIADIDILIEHLSITHVNGSMSCGAGLESKRLSKQRKYLVQWQARTATVSESCPVMERV